MAIAAALPGVQMRIVQNFVTGSDIMLAASFKSNRVKCCQFLLRNREILLGRSGNNCMVGARLETGTLERGQFCVRYRYIISRFSTSKSVNENCEDNSLGLYFSLCCKV